MIGALVAVVAAAGTTFRVDPSPLVAVDGAWPLARSLSCPETPDREVLGVAVVVYSRRGGASAYGHASLRTTWCEAGRVHDVEWEVYRLGAWNERILRLTHAGQPWLEGDWVRSQYGALVLFRDDQPVDGGWFRESMADNREIYELWLDLPPERGLEVLATAEAAFDAQQRRFEAHEDLPLDYVSVSRNCTSLLREALPELDPGSALPFVWLRELDDDAVLRVMHPSAWLARRWERRGDPWPSEVRRPHPVFRFGHRLPEAVPAADPLGPWLSGASPSGARASP